MEPFECEEYIRNRLPDYYEWPQYYSQFGIITKEVKSYIPVKIMNITPGEMALQRGAQVEATDGNVGQIDELLINSNTMQVTDLVINEKQLLEHREITVPVSQIDRVYDGTVYLKLDRQSVKQLPTTPIQRWPQDDNEKARLESGAYFPLRFSSEGYIKDFKLK